MYELTKEFSFEAAHKLPHHDGHCARLHGHSFRMKIYLMGNQLEKNGPKKGMLVDFSDVSRIVKPLLGSHLDHHYLNKTTGLENPTSEELSRWIFLRLVKDLPRLAAVEVLETCTSSCLYQPNVFIYALVDPSTKQVRYIGKTANPKARYTNHITHSRVAKFRDIPVYKWIRNLEKYGKMPKMVVLEEVPLMRWESVEQHYIEKYREEGNLLNVQDGGMWLNGFQGRQHSEESKKKTSQSLKGRIPWNAGKTLSEEHKNKIKASVKLAKSK